jgi:hypothetical protein
MPFLVMSLGGQVLFHLLILIVLCVPTVLNSGESLSDRKGLLFTRELFRVCSLVQKSGGKIKTLKFDVGYIDLCSQPVQLLTQLLGRSLTYSAVLRCTSTYTGYR